MVSRYLYIIIVLLPFACLGQAIKVKDIVPIGYTAGNAPVVEMKAVGAQLFFISGDGALWVSDGSTAGTQIVKTFTNSAYSAWDGYTRSRLFSVNGCLLFFVIGQNNEELWRSDGTENGTFKIRNVTVPHTYTFTQTDPLVVNNNLYFIDIDSTSGAQLWKTNGTNGGTVLVKYIYNKSYRNPPIRFIGHEGKLFFWADDSVHGMELWISDGTESGTHIVKDINPAPGVGSTAFVDNRKIEASVGGYLYFAAKDTFTTGIWKTDGTDTGTHLLKYCDFPQNFTNVGGMCYYEEDSNAAIRLGQSDGTPNGTVLLDHFVQNTYVSSFISSPESSNFYMEYNDTLHGNELWLLKKNGTSPVMVKDIFPGANAGLFTSDSFCMLNDIVFFPANDGVHGDELWRSDGTDAGTYSVADVVPGIRSSYPNNLTLVGQTLYFIASNDTGMAQLWKYTDQSAVVPLSYPDQNWFVYMQGQGLCVKNLSSVKRDYQLVIYDVNGKRLAEFNDHYSSDLQLFHLPPFNPGIYFCSIISSNGCFTQKIMFQGQ